MDAARRTWISSTLGGEAPALAAAGAVLAWHDAGDVCGSLWTIGAEIRARIGGAIAASGVDGIAVDGIDPMWLLRFDDPAREQRFLELAASHGVLFKRGAYNFAALAHDEDAIREIERGASARSSTCATRTPRVTRRAAAPAKHRSPAPRRSSTSTRTSTTPAPGAPTGPT